MAKAKPFEKGFSFSFTLNNPKEGLDPAKLFDNAKNKIKYAVWQLECGKESKVPHYQGHVRLVPRKLQYRIREALGVFSESYGKPSLFGIKVSELASLRYAQKTDETYRAGPWTIGEPPTTADEVRDAKEEAGEATKLGGKEMAWGTFWREQCMIMMRDAINGNSSAIKCANQLEDIMQCIMLRKPFSDDTSGTPE